MKNYK